MKRREFSEAPLHMFFISFSLSIIFFSLAAIFGNARSPFRSYKLLNHWYNRKQKRERERELETKRKRENFVILTRIKISFQTRNGEIRWMNTYESQPERKIQGRTIKEKTAFAIQAQTIKHPSG